MGSVSFTSYSSLVISKFSYDGLGPDAFFLVGTSGKPGESGTILSYPADGRSFGYFDQQAPIIRRSFDNEEVMLTLPEHIPADRVAWLSVWCRQFSVDFGSVMVQEGLDLTPLETQPTKNRVNDTIGEDYGMDRQHFSSEKQCKHDCKGDCINNCHKVCATYCIKTTKTLETEPTKKTVR